MGLLDSLVQKEIWVLWALPVHQVDLVTQEDRASPVRKVMMGSPEDQELLGHQDSGETRVSLVSMEPLVPSLHLLC